jgi:hypothetical protein
MSPYFESYLANYQRIRLCELLEVEGINARRSKAKASLVVNPLTGLHDEYQIVDEPEERPLEPCMLRYNISPSR